MQHRGAAGPASWVSECYPAGSHDEVKDRSDCCSGSALILRLRLVLVVTGLTPAGIASNVSADSAGGGLVSWSQHGIAATAWARTCRPSCQHCHRGVHMRSCTAAAGPQQGRCFSAQRWVATGVGRLASGHSVHTQAVKMAAGTEAQIARNASEATRLG